MIFKRLSALVLRHKTEREHRLDSCTDLCELVDRASSSIVSPSISGCLANEGIGKGWIINLEHHGEPS